MNKLLLRWAINAIALYAAVQLVPGINFDGGWTGLLLVALVFGLLNALLRPVLKLLSLPFIILSLGLFTLVINTFMLLLTSWVGQGMGLGLSVDGFWPALLGSLVISLVSMVLSLLLHDELKGRKKNRD